MRISGDTLRFDDICEKRRKPTLGAFVSLKTRKLAELELGRSLS